MFRTELDDFDPYQRLVNVVKAVMKPFRPCDVVVYITDDIRSYKKVEVCLSNLPNDPCHIDDYRIWTTTDPQFLSTEIGLRAGKHFKALYIQPESHISLGEN